MKVKVLRRHGYDNRIRAQGEEYEIANPKHVRLLEAVGKIRRIAEKVARPVVVEEKKTERPKRRYRRKDMLAEEPIKADEVAADAEDSDEV